MRRINVSLLVGTFLGLLLIALAIAIEIGDSSPAVFLHPVAVLIVFGGTGAAALIQMPFGEIKRVVLRTYYAIRAPKDDPMSLIAELIRISTQLNKDMMFLEKAEELSKNVMLSESLKLISMGFRAEEIKRFLNKKREQNSIALMSCYNLYSTLAKMGPAFGLVGTLIGLIVLLYYHMSGGEMGKVASSMGVALTATLYGVGLANLIFQSLAEYMMYTAEKNEALDEIVIEGAILLKERKHPLYLVQSLKWYVPREDYPKLDAIMQREVAGARTAKPSGEAESGDSSSDSASRTDGKGRSAA